VFSGSVLVLQTLPEYSEEVFWGSKHSLKNTNKTPARPDDHPGGPEEQEGLPSSSLLAQLEGPMVIGCLPAHW
jgi:hypothetical protein